jgi:hypothetical protein
MAKVNISLPEYLWRQFRMACLEHKTSASYEIACLIEAHMLLWETQKRQQRQEHGTPPVPPITPERDRLCSE